MYKKLIFIFFIFFIENVTLSAQASKEPLSILIYSEGEGFLQPFIENTVKNLKNIKTSNKYFRATNSFNRFIADNKYQAELSKLIQIQKPENEELGIFYSDTEKKIRKRIFQILKDYNYFLTVKTNTLGELIEFQFQLYKTINSKKNTPFNISDKVIKVENFFINPKKANYKSEIKNAIDRLFKGSNERPISELRIFDEIILNNSKIKIPLNKYLVLDGTNSGDTDSKKIIYYWRNIPRKGDKYQTFNKLSLKANSSRQNIYIDKEGPFKIGFKIYDGVSYSKEIIVNLETVKKPNKITTTDTVIYSIHKGSMRNKHPKRNQIGHIYFSSENSLNFLKNNLIISNKPLGDKYFGYRHKKHLTKLVKIDSSTNRGYIIKHKTFFNFPRKKTEKKLFLYTLGIDSILSDVTKLTHKLYIRRGFSIKLAFRVSSFKEVALEKTKGLYLSTLANITKNFQIGITMPLFIPDRFEFKNYEISNSSTYEINSFYTFPLYFDKKIEPFVGLALNFYNYKQNNDKINEFCSISPSLGIDYNIFTFKYFNLKGFFQLTYDYLLKKEFSNKFYDYNFNVGLKFEL
ncbi:hypothetical protein [Tenacibaculum halocynthiae]|uniref:hypothetical protein n=1 Tax=Tenacibaculum halocynthiae TaxID=1254437 RepID=UPI0038938BFB